MGKRHRKFSSLVSQMSRRSTPSYNTRWSGQSRSTYRHQNFNLDPFIFQLLTPTKPDTLYPGRAGVPCLGIATNSDSASYIKCQLKNAYRQYGLPFRCHTCGASLEGGQWVGRYFLETSWIGDHQPPTSAWQWPEKMQYIESFTSHVMVVESQNLIYQTRYPVPPQLSGLFQYRQPHRYPLYVYYYGQKLPQRYIYPQCESCSRLQSHSL